MTRAILHRFFRVTFRRLTAAISPVICSLLSSQLLTFKIVRFLTKGILEGLKDTARLMSEEARILSETRRRTDAFTNKQLRGETEACRELLEKNQAIETPAEWFDLLNALQKRAEVISDTTGALSLEHGDEYVDELRFWASSLIHQTKNLRRDLEAFLPWSVAKDFSESNNLFNMFPTFAQLPELYEAVLMRLNDNQENLQNSVKNAAKTANQILTEFNAIVFSCENLFEVMDFGFLLDKERRVFVIGYNVEAEKTR